MKFVKQQWFLIGLVLIFAAVLADGSDILAGIGMALKSRNGPSIAIFVIFILSGMVIETHQIRSGIKDMKSTLTALFLIVFIAPAAALAFCLLPLDTGILLGICIVAVMPTTLSSGVVMTGTAGGNMAQALFITILSNFIAIVSIPLILPYLLGTLAHDTTLSIDKGAIFFKLIFLVLLPLLVGMGLKTFWITLADRQKKNLQIGNQCLILIIVFMSLSSAKSIFLTMGGQVLTILALVFCYHLILLLAGFSLIRLLRIPRGTYESVLFMGAQKTLPLAVMIQLTYFSEYGGALLVCVMHHIIHLIMDAYLCQRLRTAAGCGGCR